ncbi:MAG: penicillin-binding protein, partial [Dietzia cercidiphylli]
MTPTPFRRRYPSSVRRRFGPATGLVATALTVALTGAGCAALTGDTGADELDRFLDELSRGNLPAAVELTTNPEAAQESVSASITGMGMPTISATTTGGNRPDRDPVAVEITWDMGAPGGDDGTGGDGPGGDDEAGSDPAGGTPGAEAAPRIVTTTGEARTTKIGEDW